MAKTKIRFLGVAAFEVTNSQGQVVLIDPFIDENPSSPVKVAGLERVDLILVTHLAYDHLGDATAIANKFACPVVCGPEVKTYLVQSGVSPDLIRTVPWGGQVNPGGIRVRALECRHTSYRQSPKGDFLSGQPLSFILYADPGVRIYHSGDTAIFSDLKLIGELYRPNIGLMCACEIERSYLEKLGLKDHYGNEMNGDEGALASMWLGLEYAIICHFLNTRGHTDIERFFAILQNRTSDERLGTKPVALNPGEIFEYEGRGD